MRKLLEAPQQRAARDLAITFDVRSDFGLDAQEVALHRPSGERYAVTDDAKARALSLRHPAQIVRAHRGHELRLRLLKIARRATAALGIFDQSRDAHQARIAVEIREHR